MAEDIGPSIVAIGDDGAVADMSGITSHVTSILGACEEDQTVYHLKWVPWKEDFAPVITQNENGPCPLLALGNVLLLRQRMKLAPGTVTVTSSHLLHLIATCMLEDIPKGLSDGERRNYEQNVQDAVSVFPRLPTGLDVNVRFTSVTGFEFTSESGVFDLLRVRLYHGWLPDPQEKEVCEIVSGSSYNELVEMIVKNQASGDPKSLHDALVAEGFLSCNASQLTYHGLCELGRLVGEDELAVFFRNNHFTTLYKRKGQLLLLVTDHGFVQEDSHVWEVLGDVGGGGGFLDGRFQLSGHSTVQQSREGHTPPPAEATPTEATPPPSTDLDYQIALGLHNVELSEEKVGLVTEQKVGVVTEQKVGVVTDAPDKADHELAVQLQREEFSGKAQRAYTPPQLTSREQHRPSNDCCFL